jgi:hypothetical protein
MESRVGVEKDEVDGRFVQPGSHLEDDRGFR